MIIHKKQGVLVLISNRFDSRKNIQCVELDKEIAIDFANLFDDLKQKRMLIKLYNWVFNLQCYNIVINQTPAISSWDQLENYVSVYKSENKNCNCKDVISEDIFKTFLDYIQIDLNIPLYIPTIPNGGGQDKPEIKKNQDFEFDR